MQNRRRFIADAARAGAFASLPLSVFGAGRSLKILFMGGTGFLGPHTVRAAVEAGHEVTLFNRGRTNPEIFPNLETIVGDRNTQDIRKLAGRRWDAVIDTSAYFPRSVNATLDALAENVEQYVLISSISVYTTWSVADMDESAAVRRIPDPTVEEIRQPATYGALKAMCEEAAGERIPGRVTSIRPGFISGPGDETDRFTYWPVRIERGGEVLAPGSGRDGVQFIDVRDLAVWIVHCLDNGIVGTFNAHLDAGVLMMADWLENCRATLNRRAMLTWVDAEFLQQHGVLPQSHMPIWLPGGTRLSARRAYDNGLVMRPLSDTVRDTWEWFSRQPAARRAELRAGISAESEADVLRAWHARLQ